ncbi:MAG: hypothetical protein GQ570_07360 [Helicobacteraceae bacterium]|nr:hypothetical protein [Helicobacteraceae bacterium]
MKKGIILSLIATALLADGSEVESLKKQIELLQTQLNNVKEKLVSIDTKNDSVKVLEHKESLESLNAPSSYKSAFSQSSFMPDISLVVDASYVSRNIKDSAIAHLEVPGVAHGIYGSHEHNGMTHTPMNANSGFNLNYAELGINSSVDNLFDLSATFHFSNSGVDIEEAFFTTTSLPYDLRVKGGKFLSDFGRLNSQHQHVWDFSDAPLIYKSFFGNHNINEIGASAQVILPTSFYSFVGFEALQGDNTSSFGTSAIAPTNNAEDIVANKPSQPNLLIGYVKGSVDFGDTSLLTGISYATAKARMDHQGDENAHAFAGQTNITDIELTTKTYFDSYSYLMFQGEWMRREMQGIQYAPNSAQDAFSSSVDLTKSQDGYYAQLVYAFNKEYKVGARYDSIYKNDVIANGVNQNKDSNLDAYSFKFDYKPSEFALLRLQYNRNNALFNEEGSRQNLDEIIFEMNFAIGAHPAHNF